MAKWLAGFLIGFAAGVAAVWIHGIAVPNAPQTEAERSASPASSVRVAAGSDAPAPSDISVAPPGPRTLHAILEVPSDFEQTVLLYNLIRTADAERASPAAAVGKRAFCQGSSAPGRNTIWMRR